MKSSIKSLRGLDLFSDDEKDRKKRPLPLW